MTGISLNIRPTGGCREPSLRSAAPVFSGRNNSMSIKIYVRFFPGDIIIVGEKKIQPLCCGHTLFKIRFVDVAVSASAFFPSTCSAWKWPVVGLFRPKNGPARPPARQEVARAAPQKPHGLSKSAGERPGRSRGDMDGAGLRDRAQGARSATPPLAVLQVDRDQVSEWVWIRASNIVMDSVRLWVGQDRETSAPTPETPW